MKNTTRIVLICAGAAVAAGAILMLAGYFSGAKLTITRDQSGVHAVDLKKRQIVNAKLRPFENIDCSVECDVTVVSGNGYSIKINNSLYDGLINYSVQNGRLIISDKINRHDDQMNMNFGVKIPKSIVTVTVPKGKRFGTVKLNSDFGDIATNGLHTDTLTVDTDDGDCDVQSGQSNSLSVTDNYGDVNLQDITADTLAVKAENGDLLLKTINAGNVTISNDYGQTSLFGVKANNLTTTNGNGDISLGEVRVQKRIAVTNEYGQSKLKSVTAGMLSVSNDNGEITLADCKGTSCALTSEYGDITAKQMNCAGLTVDEQNGDVTLAGNFTGTNRITSAYGAIQLDAALSRSQYNIDVSLDLGDLTLDGHSEKSSLTENNRAKNALTIQSDDGDVAVNFGR